MSPRRSPRLLLVISLLFHCSIPCAPLRLRRSLPEGVTEEAEADIRAVDLDLHARLLSDELTCDFDGITFCRLHNNGGWSFKQSLLELVEQLSQKNSSRRQNHFICADWGVSLGNGSRPSPNSSTERVATLEVFLVPPSSPLQALRQTSGKVFYVGASPPELPPSLEAAEERLCLELDLRLPSAQATASKVIIKFRSMSQTIEAAGIPQPLELTQTTNPTSLERQLALFSSLVTWLLWGDSPPARAQKHLRAPTPPPKLPLDTWLHLSLPLDTTFLQPDSPIHFALYGEEGACSDNLLVKRCPAASAPTISWPPNVTLSLTRPLVLLAPNEAASAFPIFTGAFFFTCLLVSLLAVLVIVCVASIACNRRQRRRSMRREAKRRRASEKERGLLTFSGAVIMRSSSISSLPGAAVHQIPIEEILHEESLEKTENAGFDAEESEAPALTMPLGPNHPVSLDQQRLWLRRPQRRSNWADAHPPTNVRRPPQTPGVVVGGARMRRKPRQKSGLGATEWRSVDEESSGLAGETAGQRMSLLLAINEDNELILVKPGSATTSGNNTTSAPRTNSHSSSSAGVSSGTGTTVTTGSADSTGSSDSRRGIVTSSTASSSRPNAPSAFSMETEAILQEMAASVAHLGHNSGGHRGDSPASSSSSTTSGSGMPPLYEEAMQLINSQQSAKPPVAQELP